MKELSIEEKAKAYDEAYKKVAVRFGSNVADEIFLKESEDERIRKALIRFHKSTIDIDGVKGENILSWLKKQGEQKPDKVEPKFKVGDEIKTSNEESLTVTKVDEKGYWSEDLFIYGFDDAAKWELVEQNPAWSEEDEKHYQGCLNLMRLSLDTKPYPYYNDYLWLKSLRPQK